jgi:O-antigen ligase
VSTQSRGGTLGLAAVGVFWWWRSNRKFQTAVLAAVIVAMIFALAPGAYFDRMSSIGDTQEGSAQGRITAWRAATRMAMDSPLFGVGPAHFGVKFGTEYRPADFVGSGMNAHSLYFLALGELGFPGFILVIWLIAHNLAANQRLARQVQARNAPTSESDLQLLAAGSGAMIALATAGAFLSALWYPHLYVVAGLLTAMRRVVTVRLEAAAGAVADEPGQPQMTLHWSLRPPSAAAPPRIVGARR